MFARLCGRRREDDLDEELQSHLRLDIAQRVGLYGLVSDTAKQRTHEIGIRMAVGAPRADVVRRILRTGLWLGVIGAAVGMIAAFAATRLMSALLFGVSAADPLAFVGGFALVLAAVLLASLGPAWRAACIDPLSALRHQ